MDDITKIQIAGKEYTLTFDFNAMAIIQEDTGRNPFREDFWYDIGPLELVSIIYGMLNTKYPEIEKSFLRENLDLSEIEYYLSQATEAAEKSMPKKDKDAGSQSGEKKMKS